MRSPTDPGFTFWLGTHEPTWLETLRVPLFVSRVRLAGRKKLPRAGCDWALDSGGFSELSLRGTWTVTPRQYVEEVRRFDLEIGLLRWAAIQDWMCEPEIVRKTGLSVAEHQRRTVANYEELLSLAPELPWVPVLQGWTQGDYFDHVELYLKRGHDLRRLPLVGVGTMCRREMTIRASITMGLLRRDGLRLHGFGFKKRGLKLAVADLASADSLAWSTNARKSPPLPGHAHKSCSNCPEWALSWRDELLGQLEKERWQVPSSRAA